MDYEPHNIAVLMENGYCPFPVGCDTYRNCTHACVYCYEKFHKNQHLRKTSAPIPRDYAAAFREIYKDPYLKKFVAEKKIPVSVGVLADPFPEVEAELKNTEKFLALLQKAGISWLITTKAPNRISENVIRMTLETGSLIRVSFSFLDDERAEVIEPNAPAPSVRIDAMKKMKERGVRLQVRLAPFIFGANYDYDFIAKFAHGVGIEVLRYSALWRNMIPASFWTAVLGRPLTNRRDAEDAYFGKYGISDDEKASFSDQYHWALMSPEKLRVLFQEEREKAKKAGLAFGLCCFSQAIHSVDLNDAPQCCPFSAPYDELALIPQWHKDQWAAYRPALANQLDSNILLPRLVIANAPYYQPLILGSVGDEDRFASADSVDAEAE